MTDNQDARPIDPAIEPMLVLSTAHITQETCNTFLPTYSGPAWEKGEYGWFIYVPEDLDETLPVDLAACMALARTKSAFWIMLDRDEPEVDGLPVFDW